MKKKIKDVEIGSKFKFGKIEFIKLAATHNGSLCLAADVLPNEQRFDDVEDNRNNWATSTLRQTLPSVIRKYIDTSALALFDRDLTTDDGMTEYGHCMDTVSLLTCDEYRKYRKLIPNCYNPNSKNDEWYWIITADSLENSFLTRTVWKDATLHLAETFTPGGVRPLCVLKVNTIVEVEE
jgi:hypothetical protein|nr:MAG TPA: hypothetical protein [Caudoviricetes sp.]